MANRGISLTIYHGTECVAERDTDEVLWTHRYAKSGDFTIRTYPTDDAITTYRIGSIIVSDPIYDVGIVEAIDITEQNMEIRGRTADCILERRVYEKTEVFAGKAKDILIGLMTRFTGVRALPVTITGDAQEVTVDFQKTGATILDVLQAVCEQTGLGYSVSYAPDTGTFTITTKLGEDKTNLVFSPEYDNLINPIFQSDITTYGTTAYIAGEGDGEARTVVTAGDTTKSGLDRFEIYIDARSDQKSDSQTQSSYESQLKATGTEELKNRGVSEGMCGDIVTSGGQYQYGTDYQLGDTIKAEYRQWGVQTATYTVTEVEESQTASGYYVTPTFNK